MICMFFHYTEPKTKLNCLNTECLKLLQLFYFFISNHTKSKIRELVYLAKFEINSQSIFMLWLQFPCSSCAKIFCILCSAEFYLLFLSNNPIFQYGLVVSRHLIEMSLMGSFLWLAFWHINHTSPHWLCSAVEIMKKKKHYSEVLLSIRLCIIIKDGPNNNYNHTDSLAVWY